MKEAQRYTNCFLLIFICLIIITLDSSAQNLETIPLYHWSYEVIDELTVRGYLRDLTLMNRPFTRKQVIDALRDCQAPPQDFTAQSLIQMLQDEFYPQPDKNLKLGGYIRQDMKIDKNETVPRGIAVSKIAYSFADKFTFYNGMRLDQNLQDDPFYTGKYWRGFSGGTEQAYLNLRIAWINLQFGRDWQVWGCGQNGHLLFSDNSQPFDMGRLKMELGNFTFTSSFSQLNEVEITLIDTNQIPVDTTFIQSRRFFTAHRIDWKPSNKLQIGISEAVLYGGENRTFELYYLNPFIFYHGEQQNQESEANTIVGADFIFFPGKGWRLHGEFIMDDWQFDKKKKSDLEPPEIGWIIGATKIDPLGVNSASISLEYTGITNRTYNTLQPDQKFMHQNKPIAHWLGSDFDIWSLTAAKWITPNLKAAFNFQFIRRGEGDIYDPFDTSFYQVPDVSAGYSEPFPTGIVEKTYKPKLLLWYHLNRIWDFYLETEYSYIENAQHISGKTDKQFQIRLGISADLEYFLNPNQ